jgi:hypothetical protein
LEIVQDRWRDQGIEARNAEVVGAVLSHGGIKRENDKL